MGDRANIVMKYGKSERIFFYTHWDGADIVIKARDALKKRWRWDDPAYLARIVFDSLCKSHDEETGYGISPSMCDNSYHLVELDTDKQVVNIIPEKAFENQTYSPVASLSYSDFAALSDEAAYALMKK